ncbi:MAG TPA: DUF5695 domain-containing protein [Puia sp.]|nr:DUF5695 domain-containing protein [Puia sp.]
MDKKIKAALWAVLLAPALHAQVGGIIRNDAFTLEKDQYGIGGLWKTDDRYPTNYIRKGKRLGEVTVRYRREGGVLDSVKAGDGIKPVRIAQSFELKKEGLEWAITLENTLAQPVTVEDLALPLYYNSGGGENPKEIFEERVVKHHFISGNNSFIFWERPTGVGPYLVMVPRAGTSLEYFTTSSPEERGVFQAYIHAAYTGKKGKTAADKMDSTIMANAGMNKVERRASWRQPFSSATIPGGGKKTYGFIFRWAKDYDGIRDILVQEGLIDVRVIPGMTVPNDLDVLIALRTHQKITAIVPEFPQATTLRYTGEQQPGTMLYKVTFAKLGENKLTVRYGNHYQTTLEFFVTEPLETLYKKRASFIVNHQQHKDSSKWYDGLFSIYDMKHAALRGPDNADYFDTSRLRYVLTCDDPGLCKAPFVAAKNVFYPDQKEIDALEYYIEHFVWGKLQRTDKEAPYPYGVYGTPSWLVGRDSVGRSKNLNDPNRNKTHVWRSYDYPHIMMLYYHLYQIASLYPGMTHYLDKKGYLERARETAKAFFKYPYEILPWYETYKWGCYNELLLTDLMADLEKEGFSDDAKFLRGEWEKKVKYFLYDDPYPFRSEYAIDATAFESSHALAKYALLNTLQPDSNLWFDKNLKRWYSHPLIRKEDATLFMDRQIQANIALRGFLEPAYYYLGSDFRGRSDSYTLSYMSQMGGWAILDYALHFSDRPDEYLGLGYAAYLSSFALINSGTPQSNYGFWYPGKENDGASGWAFEPQQTSTPWIQKSQVRGPWYYDGEIDLGFGGATRMAATVVTKDPVFGVVAYGGRMVQAAAGKGVRLKEGGLTAKKDVMISVIPKDGLRRRLYYRNGAQRIDIELSRDGFAKDQPVVFDPSGASLRFYVENRTGDAHTLSIHLKGLEGEYEVTQEGQQAMHEMLHKDDTLTVKVGVVGKTRIQCRKTTLHIL